MTREIYLHRRAALGLLGTAITTAALPAGSKAGPAEPRKTGLGIVIYALGVRRRAMKVKRPGQDLFDPAVFLEQCHELGAGGMQIPLGKLPPEACAHLRAKADQYGMFIEGIANPPFTDVDVERFEAEIQTAARVDAAAVRTVIIPGRRYEQFKSLEKFRQFEKRGRQALERAAPIVDRHRVRLAVENHKDQRIEERLALLRHLDSQYIGACVDTGNSLALLEDPVAVVTALAPYAFSVHLKDQAVREYDQGFLLADAALGEGFLDLKRMVNVVRRAKPDVHFNLETITRDPLPVPCLAPDYWSTFPDVPGAELARTLRMVRTHAAKELPVISSLPLEQQAELELTTVRKCLGYAHVELGV